MRNNNYAINIKQKGKARLQFVAKAMAVEINIIFADYKCLGAK